jgi:hypothetical protein
MHETFTNVHFPLATLIKLYKLLKNNRWSGNPDQQQSRLFQSDFDVDKNTE